MTDRQQFIRSLFDQLESFKYVLLKHIDPQIEDIHVQSDLDILLTKADLQELLPWLNDSVLIKKIRFSQKTTMTQVFLFFKDQSFLQLDFLFGFYRKNLCYLSDREVLDYSVKMSDGISVCNAWHLLEHLFLFNFLNFSGIPQKYIHYFEKQSPEEKRRLIDYLNDKYQCGIFSLSDLLVFRNSMRKSIIFNLNQRKTNKGIRFLKNTINYGRDLFTSIYKHRGFTITLSGVDGAGKSTILEEVKTILEQKYRRTVIVLRHRPSLLPILSSFQHGKAQAEAKAAASLPRQGQNSSQISSILRFFYYYIDYLLGQFYVRAKYLWRGYIVLYDRYYFDFIVDPKRSNIQLDQGIPKFLYRFVHHPQLNLFLYANPETILQRKQELDKKSITELTENYQRLFKSLSMEHQEKYVPIENVNKNETLKKIIEQYETLI